MATHGGAGAADAPSPSPSALPVAVVVMLTTTLFGYLLASTSALIAAEQALPPAVLGAALATYGGGAVLGAVSTRPVSRRLATVPTLAIGSALAGVALLGVSVLASAPWLVAWAALAGIANGLTQPAGNDLLSTHVAPHRQAFAFAAKQAAAPASAALAGLIVPLIAHSGEWRWGFVGSGAACLMVGALVAGSSRRLRSAASAVDGGSEPLDTSRRRFFMLMAFVAGSGAAAATMTTTFAVRGGVHAGLEVSTAGWMLTLSGILCMLCRLAIGLVTRAGTASIAAIGAMLALSAVGAALLAVAGATLYAIVVVITLSIGWAWPGIVNYVGRIHAAGATRHGAAIVQAGTSTGVTAGPLVAGLLVAAAGYPAMWAVVAVISAVGAAVAAVLRFAGRRTESPA